MKFFIANESIMILMEKLMFINPRFDFMELEMKFLIANGNSMKLMEKLMFKNPKL